MNKPANVMFIVLDTLRLDTLYDNIDRYPAFSSLVDQSTLYNNVKSTASWTVPSHASMFTGMYLNEHGIDSSYENDSFFDLVKKFPSKCNPIPVEFRKRGYNTYSIVNNNMLGKGTAFAEGFDELDSVGPFVLQENHRETMREIVGKDNLEIIDAIEFGGVKLKSLLALGPSRALRLYNMQRNWKKEWKKYDYPRKKGAGESLKSISNMDLKEPFFTFFNLMEAHEPYHGAKGFAKVVRYYSENSYTGKWDGKAEKEAELEKMKESLPANLASLDNFLGGLISHLKEKGVYDNTAFVVVSDHGQCFGEDNFVGHGYLLNDYLVNVPMILKMPEGRKKVNDDYISTFDVYNVMKSIANGESADFPKRDFVFSESFGVSKPTWKKRLGDLASKHKPDVRKRIWSKEGYSLTVNGSKGEIEEFSYRGKPEKPDDHREAVSDLLTELSIFTGSENFTIPEI